MSGGGQDDQDQADKEHDASQKKLDDARAQGDIARSQDVLVAASYVAFLAATLGLGARLDHRPTQLSGGEQQRVAVARALANQPLLVLADEPTGNLDEATADIVLDAFLTLVREQGSAALIATHNERIAARMDRCVRLHDGVIE